MHRTKLLSGGTLSGASWPSTWPFFKREPSNSNGHLLLLARLHCTGQKSSAPDNCPVRFLARAPTPQSARLHRTERHRTDPLSGALSGAFCTALLRLGYATGQNSPGTVHVRCLPGTFVRCSFSFCFARAVSRPRAPEHRTEPFCPVHCPVLASPLSRVKPLQPESSFAPDRKPPDSSSVRCSVRCTETCVSPFQTSPKPASQARREGE